MRIQAGLLVAITLLETLTLVSGVWAWSVPTHQFLSERAAQVSGLNTRILGGLGFQDLNTTIAGNDFNGDDQTQSILLWIRAGAEFEDSDTGLRYRNHFHNPLRPWPDAGLNDVFTGDSSLLWVQSAGSNNNPNWDWNGVRASYYNALTLETKSSREQQFARVFSGLGHIIHLIQDVAQPAHVRNDNHFFEGIGLLNGMESWAESHQNIPGDDNDVGDFAANPIFPSLSLSTGWTIGNRWIEPIANFWDTDQYEGETTGFPYWPANGVTLGLAEYTNGSYFSADTINSSNPAHWFPRPPAHIGYYYVCRDDPPATAVWGAARWYISRYPCPTDPQQRPDHFLAHSLLGTVLLTQPDTITPSLRLDDRVMEDYARDLIPRAVGYSAALIDYFFRGELTVEVVDDNLVRVVNRSDEPLNQGMIKIFYDTNDQQNRVILATYTLSSPIAPGQATDTIVIIPPPSDPADPNSNLTPGRYGAVFQGTLGAETNAVIGFSRFAWQENWDHPQIRDDHNWYQTTLDPLVDPPSYGGQRSADLLDTQPPPSKLLKMRNYRPAGVPGSQIGEWTLFQPNLTLLGQTAAYPTGTDPVPHYDAFPITLLPDTELQVKVDALTASFPTPAPQCLVPPWEAWHNGAYQHLVVEFNYGDYELDLTLLGQQLDTRKVGPSDGLIVLTPGQEPRINLYQALQAMGAPVGQQGFNISAVRIEQLLLPPCETTTIDQEQILEIDYLRFVDVPPGTP